MSAPWRVCAEGVIVVCRLTPKGGRDALEGMIALADGSRVLACRVRAAPEDGKANAALCRLIAEAAGAPASRARVAAGAKGRIKQVLVAGESAALLASLIRSLDCERAETVMAGFVPATHDAASNDGKKLAGDRRAPRIDTDAPLDGVDGRDKPGHDKQAPAK